MRVGTKSVLFGVHAFAVHPLLVGISWRILYRRWPRWSEWVAIFLHDNYWGLPNIDGVEGKQHPARNAKLARWLGGLYAEELVRFHSRTFARAASRSPSALCAPDKYSILLEPEFFYLWRARLSGEIKEFMHNARQYEGMLITATEEEWLRLYKEKVMSEFACVIYIPLTQGLYAKVDADAAEDLWGRKWRANLHSHGAYAVTQDGQQTTFLHHLVLGHPKKGMVVDHINGDGLDNRRCNLRFCSQSQNLMNSRPQVLHDASAFYGIQKTSSYKGVSRHKKRWRAYIKFDGVQKHLGLYESEEAAARAYNVAAKELFGEFARLNPV